MKKLIVIAVTAFLSACGQSAEEARSTDGGVDVAEEAVIIENDGWVLKGAYRFPQTRAIKPAALLLHSAAGDKSEYDVLSAALAARDVSSLALDLRGHGESINLGKFEEPYADNLHINENVYRDVIAALEWLAAQPDVDANALAVVGASYSGEAAGFALREGGPKAVAYMMLSPGNFSDVSIAAAEASGARWQFIRSENEGPASKPHIDALFEALEEQGPSLERRVLSGSGHATELFEARPELSDEMADWIAATVYGANGE